MIACKQKQNIHSKRRERFFVVRDTHTRAHGLLLFFLPFYLDAERNAQQTRQKEKKELDRASLANTDRTPMPQGGTVVFIAVPKPNAREHLVTWRFSWRQKGIELLDVATHFMVHAHFLLRGGWWEQETLWGKALTAFRWTHDREYNEARERALTQRYGALLRTTSEQPHPSNPAEAGVRDAVRIVCVVPDTATARFVTLLSRYVQRYDADAGNQTWHAGALPPERLLPLAYQTRILFGAAPSALAHKRKKHDHAEAQALREHRRERRVRLAVGVS